MMFLYISMVRSSYIIILPGMGDDVPILGALVTHLTAMGNLCKIDIFDKSTFFPLGRVF